MTGYKHSGSRAYSQRTAEKMIRDTAIHEAYGGKRIVIIHPNGRLEYNYVDLFIRPKGVRQRDHDRFVRKLISFAAKHGGWTLVDDTLQYNEDVNIVER